MGSKNNPGAFDCYANAHPDEPMFVLLGRDPDGPALVEAWATVRERNGEDPAKVAEARACATAMRAWLTRVGKQERGTAQDTSDGLEALRDAGSDIEAVREPPRPCCGGDVRDVWRGGRDVDLRHGPGRATPLPHL